MGDVVTKSKRSFIMACVRSTGNKSTEQELAKILRRNGFSGWRRHISLPGTPDFTFKTQKIVVFVDGCLWHQCPVCRKQPKSNEDFWMRKFARNRKRDLRVNRRLRQMGWRVIRIWEHQLRRQNHVARRLRRYLVSVPLSRRLDDASI